jgi:hypothetical protein
MASSARRFVFLLLTPFVDQSFTPARPSRDGGFRSAAIGGFRPAAVGTAGAFRAAAIGGSGTFNRGAALGPGRFASFGSGRFHHGRFHHGFRRPIFVGTAFGLGLYGAYPYYYDDDYYPYYANDDYYEVGCYLVKRRVHTRYGWRVRPVQVCV